MRKLNLHIDTNINNNFCITNVFSDNNYYYKKYNCKYFFSKELEILIYIVKNVNNNYQKYFQQVSLNKTNYIENIIVTEKVNGISLATLFNKDIFSHLKIKYIDDDFTMIRKLTNKYYLEYYCNEIIKLLKIMANNYIYESDTNFNNYLIKNNKLIKIDFGGLSKTQEGELCSKFILNIDNLLKDTSIFKNKLFTENEKEIVNLFNSLHIEDTGIYKPLNEKYNILTKKILYYFMFIQLEKKLIDYSQEYIEIDKFDLLNSLYNEFNNPKINL